MDSPVEVQLPQRSHSCSPTRALKQDSLQGGHKALAFPIYCLEKVISAPKPNCLWPIPGELLQGRENWICTPLGLGSLCPPSPGDASQLAQQPRVQAVWEAGQALCSATDPVQTERGPRQHVCTRVHSSLAGLGTLLLEVSS